ncbi:MAG TPA: hypothetical protein DCE44_23780 [Verrucomicrobiales bacterium]|nr:hypothetical protein [Verrucomicrobiales bacterium]
MRASYWILSLLLSASTWLLAGTYYIDFAAGNDSSDGTSPSTAWRRCPGDPSATGNAQAKSLRAGDLVIFKGGVVYVGTIKIVTSGTATAPIIFDGNDSDSWGFGRAIIDRTHLSGARCFTGNANVSHIVIRGFELRNCGGYRDDDPILSTTTPITSPPDGVGVDFFAGGHKNLRFENLYLHRIGQWRNQIPFSGGNSITGTGISLQNCDGVLIRNCEFTKMRNPIAIKSIALTKNIEVDRCDLHDYFVWGVDIAPRKTGAAFSDIWIHDTIIRDYHQYDSGNWLGYGEKPHTDGIFLRTSGISSGWTNINVFNCSFYTDYPGNSIGGTASIYVSQGPSVNIYNNVFNRDKHTRVIGIIGNVATTNPQFIRIYNNSFLNGPTQVYIAGESNTSRRAIHIRNNIFYRTGQANYTMINYESGTFPNSLDYNIYFDPAVSASKRYVFMYAGNYRTLSSIQNSGYEPNGRYLDPGYLDIIPTLPSADDLRLTVGANALARGINLSTVFQIDKASLPRVATGPWDVGAYTGEATSISTLDPNPPVNLRLVSRE